MDQPDLDTALGKLRIDRSRKRPRRVGGLRPLASDYAVPRRKIEVSSTIIGRVKEMFVEHGQLHYTVIRAPISGTILEKLADNDLPKAHVGQECEIRLDSAPNVVFKGRVDELAPEADRQKGTVQAKVAVRNPRGLVRPEASAQVTLLADKPAAGSANPGSAGLVTRKPRVWVPRSALRKQPGGQEDIVYVATNGKAVARTVKVGAEGPNGVEIAEGLSGTELVIVEPLDRISNGRRVSLAP